MEKKEILKIVNECFSCDCSVEYPDSELYFMNDFMEKKFMDFISQELDKAREEGYQRGLKEKKWLEDANWVAKKMGFKSDNKSKLKDK